MEQYISKSALVAEIEKLKSNLIHGACSSQVAMETRCKEEAGKQYLERSNPDRVHQITNAFKAGAKWQKEQMMTKAIDADCFGFQGAALFSFRLPADNYLVGSKVKVIVIKEDLI